MDPPCCGSFDQDRYYNQRADREERFLVGPGRGTNENGGTTHGAESDCRYGDDHLSRSGKSGIYIYIRLYTEHSRYITTVESFANLFLLLVSRSWRRLARI